MAMNLNAEDLAIATAYRRSVERQLIQILEETKAACELPGVKGNQWSHDPRHLSYSSPWIDDQYDVYVQFGFDFARHDSEWSVERLRLPSAFFAVRGKPRSGLDQLLNWGPPPADWGSDYLWVKQLASLDVCGDSLHAEYVRFFLGARSELWDAASRC